MPHKQRNADCAASVALMLVWSPCLRLLFVAEEQHASDICLCPTLCVTGIHVTAACMAEVAFL